MVLINVGVFVLLFFTFFFLFFIATNHLATKISKAKETSLKIMLPIIYALFGVLIFLISIFPFELRENSSFRAITYSYILYNDFVYVVLLLLFFVISITSLPSTKKTTKESFFTFLKFVLISTVMVFVLNELNYYFFDKRMEDYTLGSYRYAGTQVHINEVLIHTFPGILWIYFLSSGKQPNFQQRKRNSLRIVPILIWYLLAVYVVCRPFLFSNQQYNALLEELGAFG